jgi:hypothetical protein
VTAILYFISGEAEHRLATEPARVVTAGQLNLAVQIAHQLWGTT